MWANYLVQFATMFFAIFEFVGAFLGIVVFIMCLKGNIKVRFFDLEDDLDD